MASRERVRKSKTQRHAPLGTQMSDAPKSRVRRGKLRPDAGDADREADAGPTFVDARLSQSILQLVHEQQQEEGRHDQEINDLAAANARALSRVRVAEGSDDDDAAHAEDMANDVVLQKGLEEDGTELFHSLVGAVLKNIWCAVA